MMKNEYNPNMIHQAKIYRRYQNTKEGKALFDEMVKMAEKVDELPHTPKELAERIMDQVENYEANWDMVSDVKKISGSVDFILEELFLKIASFVPEQRMEILRQLYFGFGMMGEADIQAELNSGMSAQELYRKKYARPIHWTPQAEEELETKLKERINHLRIHPAALERMKKKILKNNNYVATAAALRKDGYALKCITAMELYLTQCKKGEDMLPELAALNACSYVDLEAIADGARVGRCFETAAEMLFVVLLITVVVCAIGLILAVDAPLDILLVVVGGLGLMELIEMIGQIITPLVGQMAVIGTHLVKKGAEALEEGFETLKEKVMASQCDVCLEIEDEFEEEENYEAWDEMTDNMYVY